MMSLAGAEAYRRDEADVEEIHPEGKDKDDVGDRTGKRNLGEGSKVYDEEKRGGSERSHRVRVGKARQTLW